MDVKMSIMSSFKLELRANQNLDNLRNKKNIRKINAKNINCLEECFTIYNKKQKKNLIFLYLNSEIHERFNITSNLSLSAYLPR